MRESVCYNFPRFFCCVFFSMTATARRVQQGLRAMFPGLTWLIAWCRWCSSMQLIWMRQHELYGRDAVRLPVVPIRLDMIQKGLNRCVVCKERCLGAPSGRQYGLIAGELEDELRRQTGTCSACFSEVRDKAIQRRRIGVEQSRGVRGHVSKKKPFLSEAREGCGGRDEITR